MIVAEMKSCNRSILVEIPMNDNVVEELLRKLTNDYHFSGFFQWEDNSTEIGETISLENFIQHHVMDGWDYFVNKQHIDPIIKQFKEYLN